MPWKEVSAVDLREEFVMLALAEGSNMRELCRRRERRVKYTVPKTARRAGGFL